MTVETRLRRNVASRTATADSIPPTEVNSLMSTPSGSPRHSPSSTSLSSLSSGDEELLKNQRGVLLDGYGNEFQIPDYTIKDIRDAIPTHCFERSAITGYQYIARDIFLLAATFYLSNRFITPEYVPSYAMRFALWGLYTIFQGLVGTGLWVIAHECGHQSFSDSKTINDTTGWILHSALLVPYFSWKISHGKHHKATGNLERDMVFVPRTREEHATRLGKAVHELHELTEDMPLAVLGHLIGQQLFGWPLYIIANITGHNNHHKQIEGKGKGKKNGFGGGVNHFIPSSPLYERKDEHLILLSDLGIALTLGALYLIGSNYGFQNLLVWYIIPYLWVNHWLVAITFLQHTDPSLPHYDANTWTFTRGAAATIDREFGFVGRHIFHGIIETHVLHHYISTIPFYHADEATEAIKGVMGQHYRSDVEGGPLGFFKAMWRSAWWCQWVEPSVGAKGEGKGVMFFRNRNGLGTPPAPIAAPAA